MCVVGLVAGRKTIEEIAVLGLALDVVVGATLLVIRIRRKKKRFATASRVRFDLKGVIEGLGDGLGADFRFEPGEAPGFRPPKPT